MKTVWILFLSFTMAVFGNTQDPYSLDKHEETIIIAAGFYGLSLDYILYSSLEPIKESEFLALNAMEINAFDRFATELNSPAADTRSDIGMYLPFVATGSSILYYAKENSEENFVHHAGKLGLIWFETNLYNFLLTDLTKNLVKRERPYVYNSEAQFQTKEFGVNGRKSFFSGHTSFSASNAFFFARVFSDYYPDSKWKPLVWSLAITVPAWTGIERVLAGKHFPTDVITGYAIGALSGYFIPKMHLKDNRYNRNVSLYPLIGSDAAGLGLTLQF